MKITKDGFIWKLITSGEAYTLFYHIDVFALYDDDSESLINSRDEIAAHETEFGIEVGRPTCDNLNELIKGLNNYERHLSD